MNTGGLMLVSPFKSFSILKFADNLTFSEDHLTINYHALYGHETAIEHVRTAQNPAFAPGETVEQRMMKVFVSYIRSCRERRR